MEKTLFSFIWKYSKRDQILLLVLTLLLFPLLYVTLDLPKRIINDAIGVTGPTTFFLGIEIDQLTLLALLCAAFLVFVIAHGLLKMRINTMKGITSERLLRQFRFELITRITRFPKPHFQRVSQGELVSMVTAEAEPMGGIMGDALSQPLMQAGQMLTILTFLFLQSFWFGLASVALIPLQAWLIPKLQRQINLLNKGRIEEVRKLSTDVGETAAGASVLRTEGGWRLRLSYISDRLARLFDIRLQIYRKKFFMKFLNNLISQMTPFLFFSIGGYLAIKGQVSIGALVAALAAYKDLSSPWKELLTYYNQIQEMSLRWSIITERFAPSGLIKETVLQAEHMPDPLPRLTGDLSLKDVTVTDGDGLDVLQNLSLTIPAGATIGIKASNDEERRAFCEVLTREVLPSSGVVAVGGTPLAGLHQSVVATRIGTAGPTGFLFRGRVGDNVLMPLINVPGDGQTAENATIARVSAEIAGLAGEEALQDWWHDLIEAVDPDQAVFGRALSIILDPMKHADLARELVSIRPILARRIAEAGLEDVYYPFDREVYNPALTVVGNLLFAIPNKPLTRQMLLERDDFWDVLGHHELQEDLLTLALDVVELLQQTFGADGTDHPLFRRMGLEAETFQKARTLASDHRASETRPTSKEDIALLLSIPFQISAEQIGPAFTKDLKARILAIRVERSEEALRPLSDMFEQLDETQFTSGLDVIENALFGKLSKAAGGRTDALKALVVDTLTKAGLLRPITTLFQDLEVDLDGGNLTGLISDLICLSRAVIKRPDILILDSRLAYVDESLRPDMRQRIRRLLPETTLIYLEAEFETEEALDKVYELIKGRLPSSEESVAEREDSAASADLQEKARTLKSARIFSGLHRKQLRLLAFGSQWFTAKEGKYVFRANDKPTDGAYLIVEGTAGLYGRDEDGADKRVAEAGPGTLIGELGLISDEPRRLDFKADTDIRALRLGAEEFLDVVEHDAATSFKLLQVVTSYLSAPPVAPQVEPD